MHAKAIPEDLANARAEFYRRTGQFSFTPLREVVGALVPPSPRPAAVPAIWRYNEARTCDGSRAADHGAGSRAPGSHFSFSDRPVQQALGLWPQEKT